ncbi:hypothetical protein QSJ19_15350 [Gordonia sp. ABSL11-1]|uniref:hypothetical protein n=1 Tax=Gordonia sp. ABSL11-1 TaxID=3053924 RepID=UPI002573F977|nr:hypothetical protein [Gordonia sp. ABSL11-1]MDL9946940.1 hypothetical protein [Gordonia sp. ABSL11-1]
MIAPDIVATVTSVHESSCSFRRDGHRWNEVPGCQKYRAVEAVDRFPDSSAESSGADEIRTVIGAVIGVAISAITRPGPPEVAEHRAARQRAARTVHLTGPAELFGSTTPASGDQLILDLSAPGLTIAGSDEVPRRVVRGEAGLISVLRPAMHGLQAYADVAPGLPAQAVTDPMFVQFVVDAAEMPPSAD